MAGSEDNFQKAMSMGHSAAWDQQWDKAASCYKTALEEFPDNPKALSSLGLALFEVQAFADSLQAYQKAVQVSPNDPVPMAKVGQLSERLGDKQEAIQSYLRAAELYIKNQDTDKAITNWVRVSQLDPGNVTAHLYLAMVHERLNHGQQAGQEYLVLASLLQRIGNLDKAAEMVNHALRLIPNSSDARKAKAMLASGQLLPKPIQTEVSAERPHPAQAKAAEPPKPVDTGLDPIAEASKNAITRLAKILFDYTDEAAVIAATKRGMKAIVRGGTGELDPKQAGIAKITLHIGQAVDAQSKDQNAFAAQELEKSLEAGITDPALYFDLGVLLSKTEKPENAINHLKTAVRNAEYELGSHLLMAQIHHQAKRIPDAVKEYLEALKTADTQVVPPDQADEIRQLYEPLIENQTHQADTAAMEQVCSNVKQLLLSPNWRTEVLHAREQLPKGAVGAPPLPLGEVVAQAKSSEVIETIVKVRKLALAGHLRTAMDEIFDSFKYAPTYLPLHTLVGDLLLQDGRTHDAVSKYTVVAQAYNVRGEITQAVNLMRRIVQVAPMDLTAHNNLIELLAGKGRVDEAISEYIDLANIYYQLAELDMARDTYTTALRLAQKNGANETWSIKLMRRMADIDMQHLDWRQALRIFEQVRTLEPDDASVRKNLVELNIHLNQLTQASAEMDNFLSHMQSSGRRDVAISFLEDLVKDNPKQPILLRALAEEYRQVERFPEAVAQLSALGEVLLNAGDREGAIQAIEMVMALNPPNLGAYRTLLTKIKSEV